MRIGIVSTYRVLCGVSIHTENLAPIMSKKHEVKVFAEYPFKTPKRPLKESLKNIKCVRCWIRESGFKQLTKEILKFKPDVVNFPFVAGLFNECSYNPNSEFQELIKTLRKNNILSIFSLNDIPMGIVKPHNIKKLFSWYKNLKSPFLVYNEDMLLGLKKWYPMAKVKVIPIGTTIFTPEDKMVARKKIDIPKDAVLISQVANFFGSDRGMEEVMDAIPKIDIPNLLVAFTGGFHPTTEVSHRVCINNCIKKSIKYNITSKVIFKGTLSEEEINLWASASDFLVFNHKSTYGYGISAGPHRTACAKVPMLLSRGPRLSEYEDGVHCVKFPDDEHIPETVMNLYNNKNLQKKITENMYKYAMETTYEKMAENYLKFFEECLDEF